MHGEFCHRVDGGVGLRATVNRCGYFSSGKLCECSIQFFGGGRRRQKISSMKSIYSLVLAFAMLFASLGLQSQSNMDCLPPGSLPPPPPSLAPCTWTDFTDQEIEDLPIATVFVNIHFVAAANGDNFYPGDPSMEDTENGNYYAPGLISHANDILSTFNPTTTALVDFLGDSRIRLELYSDPNNANDQYGGIWYWQSLNQVQHPYGNQVLDIIVHNDNSSSGHSCFDFNCDLHMHDLFQQVQGGSFWFSAAGVLLHEFGHMSGLCHSHFCNNPCNDLDPVIECDNGGGCNPDCGSGPGCTLNATTNMMGNGYDQNTITPCQLRTMLRSIYTNTPDYIHFCDDDIAPLTIPAGPPVVWDKLKILNRDVIIETGAELIVRCEVRTSPDRKIFVNRGSRLFVDGGMMTNLCRGEKWGGIIVVGDDEVSHTPAMISENTPVSTSNPGIVLIKNGAEIENANNAISTNPAHLPWAELTQGWNGVVYGEGSIFRNNKRSGEFYPDDQVNLNPGGSFTFGDENTSVCAFVGCSFLNEDGTALVGVTDWRANILFDDCTFVGMPQQGILALDAAITVKNSTFTSNTNGIYASTSAALLSKLVIGGANGEGNTFTKNTTAVYTTSIQDLNLSFNTFSQNGLDFYALGQSEYDVHDNIFGNSSKAAFGNVQTGAGHKDAFCNVYSLSNIGIYNYGNNKGFHFITEEFATKQKVDVIVGQYVEDDNNPNTPNPTTPGAIPNQGSFNDARWNYFSIGNGIKRIYTHGNTTAFNYFHPDESTTSQRVRPYCSLNFPCAITYNFFTYKTSGNNAGCLEDLTGGDPPCVSRDCLDTLRLKISIVQQQLQQGGDTLNLNSQLSKLIAEKDYVVYHLLNDWIETEEYLEAETLLREEEEQRKLFGLKIRRMRLNEARQVLDSILELTLDDTYFKTVQDINIRRLEGMAIYSLNAQDSATLHLVSASGLPSAAYAQGILTQLTGQIFEPVLPPLDSVEERTIGENEDESHVDISAEIVVFPNPTDGVLTVKIPKNSLANAQKVQVLNLAGIVLKDIIFAGNSNEVRLYMEGLLPGIYFVQIRGKDAVLGRTRFVYQP